MPQTLRTPWAGWHQRPAAGADEQQAVHRAAPWVMAALALGFGPSLFLLPWWMGTALFALLALKLLAQQRRWRLGVRTVLPLALLTLAAWAWALPHVPSGLAVVAFFCFVLALKWLEARPATGRRDQVLMLLASTVLTALGAIHHVALVSLALVLAQMVALVGALAALYGSQQPARQVLRTLGMALPVAAVLFIVTPRVEGPLWDFGLTLGLPIGVNAPRSGPGLGGQAELEPGGKASSNLEDGTVLVAQFDGYVPAVALLYWRGPVLVHFDGTRWTPSEWWGNRQEQMAAGYRRVAAWRQEMEGRGEPLRYSLRVAAHPGNWLYALDLPASLPPESYLTRDWQLLSMTPLREETRYTASAWMDWRMKSPELAADAQQEALGWPTAGNARLRALGQSLQGAGSDTQRVAAALAHFASGGYRLNRKALAHGGTDGYDHFVFEQREGGPEQFAGAFTLLVRAAGVPARLVTGYRGGRLMGTSGYVLVKQSQAHAWVETWQDGRGWVRIDPTDAVAPPRESTKKAGAAPQPALPATPATQVPQPARVAREEPSPPPDWLQAMDGWVLHYDAQRRTQLLQGLEESRTGWIWASMLAAAWLMPLLLLVSWRRMRRTKPDVMAHAWHEFVSRLGQTGMAIPDWQCPSTTAHQLRQHPAPWADAAATLADEWVALRYAGSTSVRGTAEHTLARRMGLFRPRGFQPEHA